MQELKRRKLYYQLRYNLKCCLFLPITFIRRVIFGRNQLCKRFFWEKWGFLPKELIRLTAQRKSIWIITNSGGELNQAITFFKKIKQCFSDYNLFVSTESYDTYEYAKKLQGVDFVFFPPWDMPFTCRRVLKKLKPRVVMFVEHCYFPILAQEAKKLKIKTLMLSGLISPQLLKGYFLMQRSFGLEFYKSIEKFALKSVEDLQNLRRLGVEPSRINVLGDMKFDLEHIILTEKEREKLRAELRISDTDLVFIVGSLHKEETDLVFEAFALLRKKYKNLKLILAPRWKDTTPFIVQRIGSNYLYALRSDFMNGAKSVNNYDILIVDTFGELPKLYGISDIAFIANSIIPINVRRLGHNIFEPLAHGLPILFGPHMNLWEAITDSLSQSWPGCKVTDAASLADSMDKVLSDQDLSQRLKTSALRLSRSNMDVVTKHLDFLQDCLE